MLNRIVLVISLLLFAFQSFAQDEKIDPNGYNKFYYPNGNLSSEGRFENGKPEGYWKNYYENGNLKSEGNRKG